MINMCLTEVCDTPASKLFVLVYIVSMVLAFVYSPKVIEKEETEEKAS